MMMKRYLRFLVLSIGIITVVSCGRYGYEFADGYQQGDADGKTPPDNDMTFVDRSLIDRARIYPGLVGENVRRIPDTTIMLDLDFKWIKSIDLRVQVTPTPILSTGLYAAAGENIRITVPNGVLGLTVQVGAHRDNLTGKDPLRRDPIIYTVKELFPGDNYVRNPYGGIIWIHAALSRSQPVALKISNAVRTSDFIRGVTDQDQWLADVEANDVPWLELRSERTIFAVPREYVIRYKDRLSVDKILATWNEIYEKDYYDWMGLQPNVTGDDLRDSYPQLPERGVLDIQPSAGYAHSGFPWVAQQDMHWFLMFSSYDYFVGSINTGEGAWGTFHEIGHNYQQPSIWSWGGLGETTNNLFVFKTANRYGNPAIANHPALQGAFTKALAFAAYNNAKNFANPGSDWTDDGTVPFFKLTPFLQIFNKVKGKNNEPGWDFMPFLYTKARHSKTVFVLDQAKIDFFYRTLCEFTGKDYFRFFNAWGIGLSTLARREMRNTYDPMDQQIWTYNPLTNTGGDGALGSKYDLNGSLFQYSANFPAATQTGDNGGFAVLNDGAYGTVDAPGGTYFHTCYSGCGAVPVPFIIDIDLSGVEAFKGIYYGNRANSGSTVPRMIVSISNDNHTWTEIADFTNLPTTRPGRIERAFSQVYEARYVRVTFPQLASNGHIMLSELGLFYDN
ncbi:hypothetical protein G5B30_06745 [Sphingobacterium sp. SGG-5]|uniref:M60 family metallopeptidase n=1 Tax=Sphingobacterium sp. SGG-5 TaxID=2710881 RepID=UPI0013E9C2FC|nr:M60 family metallopeptidase [Sphingobacterium sp. SGG-5]NGM61613.1 hypothetical protein [Sphingobacterium sp. SGG-5]